MIIHSKFTVYAGLPPVFSTNITKEIIMGMYVNYIYVQEINYIPIDIFISYSIEHL